MQKDLPGFLHLYHSLDCSRSQVVRVLERFNGDLQRALLATGIDVDSGGRHTAAVNAEIEWAHQPGHHLVCFLDDAYPPLLRQIPDHPALLYLKGNIELLKLPQIAMVGQLEDASAQPAHLAHKRLDLGPAIFRRYLHAHDPIVVRTSTIDAHPESSDLWKVALRSRRAAEAVFHDLDELLAGHSCVTQE